MKSQDFVDGLVHDFVATGPGVLISGMDFNRVPADVWWAIANWPEDAERTRFCERYGISRSVFYKIRGQARELGPVGATSTNASIRL